MMGDQLKFFDFDDNREKKTYRAIRHDVIRKKQRENHNQTHHPEHKLEQLKRIFDEQEKLGELKILELFAGQGNLTDFYSRLGFVEANEKKSKVINKLKDLVEPLAVKVKQVDSYLDFHERISKKEKFDIIDIDPYGFPTRFFPDIYKLIDNGWLIVSMPKPSVNILNGMTATHLISYFGEQNPSFNVIVEKFATWGLCHWRKVTLVDWVDCKSIWRLAFTVEKVKATEYTGVKNR